MIFMMSNPPAKGAYSSLKPIIKSHVKSAQYDIIFELFFC